MADSMHIEITDNSGLVKEEFQAAVLRALKKCGLMAEGYAKKLQQPDTGLLRNSITHALSGQPTAISSYKAEKPDKSGKVQKGSYSGSAPSDSGSEMSVYIGTNVEYAAHVELGTYKQQAKPYLKPAVADHAQKYQDIIKKELKNG